MYIVTSEQVLSNLQIKFTAKGSMPADSKIILISRNFAPFTAQNNSQVSVSGKVNVVREEDGQTVTATVMEGGIEANAQVVFSIPSHYKAPKILGEGGLPLGG